MAHQLTATGRVLLGMIARGCQTGYEIKQLVDKSTRHFWAASYGQIYPELRRLELDGLVRGRFEPSGARARTEYDLTEAGEEALREWLSSDDELVYELRDEGLLKLFFSDLAPDTRIENLRAMRELYARKLDQLRKLEAKSEAMATGPRLSLELGLGMNEWLIEWCQATERRLAAGDDAPATEAGRRATDNVEAEG
jgi:DNA-binding PadR family transcriptional regulator